MCSIHHKSSITILLLAWIWVTVCVMPGSQSLADEPPANPEVPTVPTDPEGVDQPADPVENPELPEDPAHEAVRISAMAEQYGVEPEQVGAMRTSPMGWGEMEIALALANRVAADLENPDEGALSGALDSILQARAEGHGWGGIAAEYDLKVGEVISSAKNGKPPRDRSADEARPTQVGKQATRADKPVRVSKAERLNRPEKPQRPDKMERPGRPEKVSRPQKPSRPSKPSKPERPEKPGRGLGR